MSVGSLKGLIESSTFDRFLYVAVFGGFWGRLGTLSCQPAGLVGDGLGNDSLVGPIADKPGTLPFSIGHVIDEHVF